MVGVLVAVAVDVGVGRGAVALGVADGGAAGGGAAVAAGGGALTTALPLGEAQAASRRSKAQSAKAGRRKLANICRGV